MCGTWLDTEAFPWEGLIKEGCWRLISIFSWRISDMIAEVGLSSKAM